MRAAYVQVRDMMKRLAAAELSNVLRAETGATYEMGPLSRADLLKDMFGNAKTTAGRLFLIKEMLQLPLFPLKAFAGTKSGLEILNTWIMVRLHCLARCQSDMPAVYALR